MSKKAYKTSFLGIIYALLDKIGNYYCKGLMISDWPYTYD